MLNTIVLPVLERKHLVTWSLIFLITPMSVSAGVVGSTAASVGRKGGTAAMERSGIVKPAPHWRNSELAKIQVKRELKQIDDEIIRMMNSRYGRYFDAKKLNGGRPAFTRLESMPENVRAIAARERIRALAARNMGLTWGKPLQADVGNYLATRMIGKSVTSSKGKIFQRIEKKLGDGSLPQAYFNGRQGELVKSFDRHFGGGSYLSFIEKMKSGDILGAKRVVGLLP